MSSIAISETAEYTGKTLMIDVFRGCGVVVARQLPKL